MTWLLKSKLTGKEQIVSDEVKQNVDNLGWSRKYEMTRLPEKQIREVPIAPPEIVKVKRKHTNGQKD